MNERITTYREYWVYHIGQHSKSGNRVLHYLGSASAVILLTLAGLMAVSLVAACSPTTKTGARNGARWAVENVLHADCYAEGCIVNVLAFPVALPIAAVVGVLNEDAQRREARRRWFEESGSPQKTLRGDPDAPDYLPCPLCRTTKEPPPGTLGSSIDKPEVNLWRETGGHRWKGIEDDPQLPPSSTASIV